MDLQILYFFNDLTGKGIYLDALFIFFAVYFPFIFAIGHFWFFYKAKKIKIFLWSWVLASISILIKEIISLFYFRQRPFVAFENINQLIKNPPGDASFPSLHTTIGFILAFSIFWQSKKWGALFLAGALLIALARIIVGVHFPIDILGGILLAFVLSLFIRKK